MKNIGGLMFMIRTAKLLQYKQNKFSIVQKIHKTKCYCYRTKNFSGVEYTSHSPS